MNLIIGTTLLCSMQLFDFPGLDRAVTLNNIPTKVMVVQNEYVTVAYDFSKFKEFTISSKEKAVLEVLTLGEIKIRCNNAS